MAKHVSPKYWQVVLNGTPLFRGIISEAAARAKAEKWQGERYKRGLLKHADFGDWVEVKRDYAWERDFDERYDEMQRGNPQRIIMHERIN